MSKIEEFFEKAVVAGCIPQTPMNYDTVAYKIYTSHLENKVDELIAENAELREKLAEAERRAEVIELALALAAENHRCEGCPSKECDGSIRGTQKCRDTIALLYIVQAERELAEEKDD